MRSRRWCCIYHGRFNTHRPGGNPERLDLNQCLRSTGRVGILSPWNHSGTDRAFQPSAYSLPLPSPLPARCPSLVPALNGTVVAVAAAGTAAVAAGDGMVAAAAGDGMAAAGAAAGAAPAACSSGSRHQPIMLPRRPIIRRRHTIPRRPITHRLRATDTTHQPPTLTDQRRPMRPRTVAVDRHPACSYRATARIEAHPPFALQRPTRRHRWENDGNLCSAPCIDGQGSMKLFGQVLKDGQALRPVVVGGVV